MRTKSIVEIIRKTLIDAFPFLGSCPKDISLKVTHKPKFMKIVRGQYQKALLFGIKGHDGLCCVVYLVIEDKMCIQIDMAHCERPNVLLLTKCLDDPLPVWVQDEFRLAFYRQFGYSNYEMFG